MDQLKRAAVPGAPEEGSAGWAIGEAIGERGLALTGGTWRQDGIPTLATKLGGQAVPGKAISEHDIERFSAAACGEQGLDCAVLVAGVGTRGLIDTIALEKLSAMREASLITTEDSST